MSDLQGQIESRDLLKYFVNMIKYRPLARMLPSSWSGLSQGDFEDLMNRFDRSRSGKVSVKQLLTLMFLQNAQIPDYQTIEDYKTRLESAGVKGRVSLDAFVELPAFFDASQEQKKTHERSKKFERVRFLKRILYEINGNVEKVESSNNKNTMDIGQFINIISLSQIEVESIQIQNKKYASVLFSSI